MMFEPVVFISCALTATERRYAQIEKEALATSWACERLADYLIGKRFLVETDHKPLVQILGSKNLEEMSPRIQRLRMRLLRFDFTMSHVPRKSVITTDALSRAPVEQQDGQSSTEEENDLYVQYVFASLPTSNTQTNCPRVYVYEECVKYWCSMRINPDLMKQGAHDGLG